MADRPATPNTEPARDKIGVRLCSHPARFRNAAIDYTQSRVWCGKCGKTLYENVALAARGVSA